MEKIILKAKTREDRGKGACKQLRRESQIPAVVYKSGKVGISIQVDNKELWRTLHTEAGENVIISLDVSGEKEAKKTVILQEIQRDPLSEEFLHVDFREISLKDKIKVKVPINIKGEAIGVKESDGVLAQVIWELDVECLPTDIPEHIDVRVDELELNDGIHVKELTVTEGVTFLNDPEDVVVHVAPPMAEEEEEVEEEALEGEEGAEPEVIKKGKEEEEGAEPEAAPSEE